MPQLPPAARPLILAGTNVESGTPNTGQIMQTLGGSRTFSAYSGLSLADQSVWVGAGRLDSAAYAGPSANTAASGIAIVFYDAAIALPFPSLSGGNPGVSGAKLLGVLLPTITNSGAKLRSDRQEFGVAFTSGLCVQATSGAPPYVVSFTPVVSG